MRNRTFLLSVLAAGLVAATALTTTPAMAATGTDTLHISVHTGLSLMPNGYSLLQENTQEGLYRNDPTDPTGGVKPALAQSVTISPDGKTYTFQLRDGIKWNDGTPIIGADFVTGWNHLKQVNDPGFVNILEIQTMTAPDDKTVVVTFNHAGDYLLRIFGNTTLVPVKQSFRDQQGANFGTTPTTTMYSGPYIVKEKASDHVTLAKNPNYWDAANVSVPNVVFHTGLKFDQASRLYQEGQLDSIDAGFLYSQFYTQQENHYNFPSDSTFFVMKTNASSDQHNPLNNAHIRQALRLALEDPNSFAQYGLVANYIWGANDQFRKEHPISDPNNVEQARLELSKGLQELGYASAADLPPITLEAPTTVSPSYYSDIWKNALGVTVNTKNESSATIDQSLSSGQAQMVLMTWMADFNDPSDFLNIFKSDGMYSTMWNDPSYDALLDVANTASDRATRMSKLNDAEQMLLNQAVVIPFGRTYYDNLVHPNVTLPVVNWANQMELKYAKKVPATALSSTSFSDSHSIPDYARPAVNHLLNTGVVHGLPNNVFQPTGDVTREQFATMLVKGLGLPVAISNTEFPDLKEDAWSYLYVQTAVKYGIIHGKQDANGQLVFKPSDPITRAEMATMLKYALGLQQSSTTSFNDLNGHWATDAILQAKQAGLISGYPDGSFHPNAHTTRADAASVIDRSLKVQPLPVLPQP